MDLVISRGYFFFFSFFSLHGSLALTLRDCENDWKNICLFIGDASMLFNRRFVNLFRLIALPPVWILMALPLLYFQFEAVGKLISLPISHRSCFIIFLLLFFPFFFFFGAFVGPIRKRIFIFGERVQKPIGWTILWKHFRTFDSKKKTNRAIAELSEWLLDCFLRSKV